MNHLFKRFRRDITGLIWLSIGFFLSLSFMSYSPKDPSFNSLGNIGYGIKVHNYCGYFGSFLADIFYQAIGLGVWVVVFAAFRMSVLSFMGRDLKVSRSRILWSTLLFVTFSSLLALYFPQTKIYQDQISLGGFIGLLISTNLVNVFNFVGVAVILWTTMAVLVVFYTERPIMDVLRAPIDWAERLVSFIQPIYYYGTSLRPRAKTLTKLLVSKKTQERDLKSRVSGLPETFLPLEAEEEVIPVEKKSFNFRKKPLAVEFHKQRQVNLRKKVQRRIENWELPKISLLEDPPLMRTKVDEKEIRQKASLLMNKLEQFSVCGKVVGIKTGPAVTLFEFKPNVDVKISKITELADDLSLALSSESVRIIAPIPGRDVVGIETSNSMRETVYLKTILAEEEFWDENIQLPITLGQRADGQAHVVDLRKMPHLMVAGSTGSGKSVFTVSTLAGLLFRHSPQTLRMILVDPKQVDLAAFNNIPHLLMPPIREPKKALSSLKWAIKEMEKRYRSMSKFGARGLESFNNIVGSLDKGDIKEHESIVEDMELNRQIQEAYYYSPQPYIVIVVEEFGDLMAVDKGNVEQAVVRLAQMARACGIHLVLAMQSPRKDVVTGLIKTNIPGRISFKVASKMDSRIILDESGAERLLSRGDMLYMAPGVPKPERHHGPWLTEEEIGLVTEFWREQGEPEYDTLAMRVLEGSGGGFDLLGGGDGSSGETSEYDERYDEVLVYVSTLKEVSASLLQRKFRLGYPRAARMIELFESEGVIGSANGSKPRQVLVNELK